MVDSSNTKRDFLILIHNKVILDNSNRKYSPPNVFFTTNFNKQDIDKGCEFEHSLCINRSIFKTLHTKPQKQHK